MEGKENRQGAWQSDSSVGRQTEIASGSERDDREERNGERTEERWRRGCEKTHRHIPSLKVCLVA